MVTEPRPPTYLRVAAGLVALQAVGMLALAGVELASFSTTRVALGVTTAAFFVGVGVALGLCARGLARVDPWARSPVVVAQLLQLLMAWSFRGGATTAVSIGLAVFALVVLVCVLHPASTRALDASPT